MLDMANVASSDVVMDLGSGDGRTVIAAARRGARGIGVELTPSLVAFSRQAAAEAGVAERTEFIEGDLFDADLSRATVITLFLLDEINVKLRPRLLRLKPGTRIVTNTFTMGDWVADDIAAVGDCVVWCTPMMWVVPADASGRWSFDGGTLTLRQAFQMVSGTLTTPRGSVAIANGRLRGEELKFSAGGKAYVVRVQADSMDGTVTSGGVSNAWHADRSGR
jgi:SAM-dependent methyltransferase